jgi:hypothetical protein
MTVTILAIYLIGTAVARFLGNEYVDKNLQRLVFGLATVIVILRLSYRENLSFKITIPILAMLIIAGFVTITQGIRKFKQIKTQFFQVNTVGPIFLIVIAILNPLYPILKDRSFFYQHIGPDLTGHLLSAQTIFEKQTYKNYINNYEKVVGNIEWWKATDKAWADSDFRGAIDSEFLVICFRYGHGIISTFAAFLGNLEIWGGLLVGICISLLSASLLIYSKFKQEGHTTLIATSTTALMIFGHSYILMVHEGITAQIFALPFILYLTLYAKKLFFQRKNFLGYTGTALIISALMSTMSEGIIIVVAYAFLLGALEKIQFKLYKSKLKTNIEFKPFIYILFLTALIEPMIFLDYIKNQQLRASQGFIYSGFGNVPWDISALITSRPYLRIDDSLLNWNVITTATKSQNLILLVIVTIILVRICDKKNHLIPVTTVALMLCGLTFLEANYPLWKTTVLLQPILMLALLSAIKTRPLKKISNVLMPILAIAIITPSVTLLNDYSKHANHLNEENFTFENRNYSEGKYAFLTPTANGNYSNLGASGSFVYLNSGWGPRFIDENKNLEIVYFYSCKIEDCNKLSNNIDFPPNRLKASGIKVETILDINGNVDQRKLDYLRKMAFGSIAEQ